MDGFLPSLFPPLFVSIQPCLRKLRKNRIYIHFPFFATNVTFYTSLLLFFLLKKLCQIFFPSIDYSSHVIRLKFVQLIPDILRVMLCLTLDLDLELFSLSQKKKKKIRFRGRKGRRESSMNQGQIIEDLERKTTPKVIP